MLIKNYDKESLERIAEKFLREYSAGKYDGRSLRVEALIESCGYQIFPVQGLAEIAEAYIPLKSGYIFVDETQYLAGTSFRWRFTLAEELAHLLIHSPIFKGMSVEEIVRVREEITDAQYSIMERNAKYLAGCLLLPRVHFRSRFLRFFDLQLQTTHNRLMVLKYAVRQTSMDFNVSCHAVTLRALHLGLIDQEQVDDIGEAFSW